MKLAIFNSALGSTLNVIESGAHSLERRKSTSSTRAIKSAIGLAQSSAANLRDYEARRRSATPARDQKVVATTPNTPVGQHERSINSVTANSVAASEQNIMSALQNLEGLNTEREAAIARNDYAAVLAAEEKAAQEMERAAQNTQPDAYEGKQKQEAIRAQKEFKQAAETMRSPRSSQKMKSDTMHKVTTVVRAAHAAHFAVGAITTVLGVGAAVALTATAPTTVAMGADGQYHEYGLEANQDGTTEYMADTNGDGMYDTSYTVDDQTGQTLAADDMGTADQISSAFEAITAIFGF